MIMFQIEEEGEKQYSDKTEKNKAAKYLLDSYKSWFKNSNKQYLIRNTVHYPMAHDMIKPIDNNELVIKWWQ